MSNRELRGIREIPEGETEQNPFDSVKFTIGAEDTNGIAVTVQAMEDQDELSEKVVLEIWLAATAGGAPSAVTSEVVDTGTELQEIVNHGHYKIITDANGVAKITWTIAGAATRYCNVLYKGRVFSSSLITWAA